MWLFLIRKKIKMLIKHDKNFTMTFTPQIWSVAASLSFCAFSQTAPPWQDERLYDQTVVPAAHPHPARPRHPQTAVVDPQDGSLPSAALASQMPQGNHPVVTPWIKSIACQSAEISVEVRSSATGEIDITKNRKHFASGPNALVLLRGIKLILVYSRCIGGDPWKWLESSFFWWLWKDFSLIWRAVLFWDAVGRRRK